MKIINKENKVFADFIFGEGAANKDIIRSFMDNYNGWFQIKLFLILGMKIFETEQDFYKCAGSMMTYKQQLIDYNKAQNLTAAIKNNAMICPKYRACGGSGTFIRKELYKIIKFDGVSFSDILNEQWVHHLELIQPNLT